MTHHMPMEQSATGNHQDMKHKLSNLVRHKNQFVAHPMAIITSTEAENCPPTMKVFWVWLQE